MADRDQELMLHVRAGEQAPFAEIVDRFRPRLLRFAVSSLGFSSAQVGPFQLQVKFVPACVPTCDGRYCGSDGCGGTCGTCGSGQECSAAGRCFTAPCTPACNGRQCGDDGCGGDCGTCGPGDLCATTDGRCVSASTCDHLQPVCKNCDPKSYCGADCACHKVDETLDRVLPAGDADQ